ncbi:MAG: ABC transporter ATP-binding protein [Oscillospiraceae bacterium]|nr:ABC transporter ATP-binding protein [Oscillospiraceae bacterium]
MNDPIIEFRNFGFQYNAQAEPTLYDINLTVRKGEKVVIVGPSGCGKSTLAHCINGLIPFALPGESTGTVTVAGKPTKDQGIFELSRTVGTVLQDSDAQFIGLTVAEDIAFALENDCVGEPELHDRVRKAAEMVSLSTHLLHAPSDLSGGQKQRVSLAGVMVDDVEVLLFDEPLANLDPATGKTAIELIDEIHSQTGAAIIIIEHRLEDVLHRDVDRIVLMDHGRILADAPPDELLSGPLLAENGIREPLYLAALKYAGVSVRADMLPHSIRTLQLGEEEKSAVRDWFRSVPVPPEPEPQPYLLRAKNVEFAYESGHKALNDVSVDIRRGEMLAIVGTNGAGKSTFSKVICGFERQQMGEISFSGCDWASLSLKERADHVGYVMQNPNQMISKTMIFDEVALGLRTRKVPEEEIRPRVEDALKVCGLWPFRNWPVSALSFGQKKRVTIASILVLDPEMIILDEPTAGQDYRHYTEIMEFLRDLNAKGVTVVLITHDMHLMLEYAPRAVVFSSGRVLADDSSAAILTDPEIIAAASLKETSLYDLALLCGIDDPRAFVQRFIDHERKEARQQ